MTCDSTTGFLSNLVDRRCRPTTRNNNNRNLSVSKVMETLFLFSQCLIADMCDRTEPWLSLPSCRCATHIHSFQCTILRVPSQVTSKTEVAFYMLAVHPNGSCRDGPCYRVFHLLRQTCNKPKKFISRTNPTPALGQWEGVSQILQNAY